MAYRDGGVVDGSCVAPGGLGLKKKRAGYADGGLVDDEEQRRRDAAAAAPQSGGAAFGLYPQLAGDARTYGLANRLRQGVTATSGPEGQTFAPAVTVAPPAPPAAAPSAQRLNATTDPRSSAYQDPAAPPAAAAEPAPAAAAPVAAPAAAAPSYPAAGSVTALPGSTDTLGQLNRDIAHQQDLQKVRKPSDPTPGVAVIGADYANRNAEFNEGAALRTAAARGSWSPRRGFQGDEAAVQAALTPIQLRAQAARTAQAEAGDTARALIAERGTEARARIADAQNAETNAIARKRLEIEAAKVAGESPAGYRRKTDGTLEFVPGGPADPSVRGSRAPLNDTQAKALQFGTRMQTAGDLLDSLASKGVNQPGLIKRAAETVGAGGLANFTQSAEQQQVEQAQRDFINAALRRESGAAIADHEFDNARKQYFPQPGDGEKVIEQKRQNRLLATRGILAEVPDSDKRVAQVRGPETPAAAQLSPTPAAAANPAAASTRPSAPQAGAQDGGYTFLGGDPADPKSWRKS
ncbi:hypothetical protein C7T35_01505 [Variovorax sp. WS11]|nr:hypothetical protein C7T35_01505 [Variovorax sp. WS11]